MVVWLYTVNYSVSSLACSYAAWGALGAEDGRKQQQQKENLFLPTPTALQRAFHICVVVQFYPWFKFCCLLFLTSVMYDNERIMSLKQKERKIQTKDKIELLTYVTFLFSSVSLDTGNDFFFEVMMSTILCNNLLFCLSIIAWRFSSACVVEANTFYSAGTQQGSVGITTYITTKSNLIDYFMRVSHALETFESCNQVRHAPSVNDSLILFQRNALRMTFCSENYNIPAIAKKSIVSTAVKRLNCFFVLFSGILFTI